MDNFCVYELDKADSHEKLCELEIYYIEKFNTYREGYNLTIGGDGVVRNVFIDVTLAERQMRFVEYVKKENLKKINVNNANEMIRCVLLNLTQLFLVCDSKIDKRECAKLLLKLHPSFLSELLKLKLFTLDELRRCVEWRSTQIG